MPTHVEVEFGLWQLKYIFDDHPGMSQCPLKLNTYYYHYDQHKYWCCIGHQFINFLLLPCRCMLCFQVQQNMISCKLWNLLKPKSNSSNLTNIHQKMYNLIGDSTFLTFHIYHRWAEFLQSNFFLARMLTLK